MTKKSRTKKLRVTTLIYQDLTVRGLGEYQHTPARWRAHPAWTTYRPYGSQAMFSRLFRTPFQLPGLSWTDRWAYSPVPSLWFWTCQKSSAFSAVCQPEIRKFFSARKFRRKTVWAYCIKNKSHLCTRCKNGDFFPGIQLTYRKHYDTIIIHNAIVWRCASGSIISVPWRGLECKWEIIKM